MTVEAETQPETQSNPLPWNAVNLDAIPQDMKDESRWINWQLEGKNKTPKHPSGYNASSTKESDWSDFATVAQAAESRGYGLGFVFNGDGIVGVDIDDCRDAVTGTITPWALRIIQELDSYSEVSPSGTGVKIFLRGTLPPQFRKKHTRPDNNGCVELYENGRYFTVTGQHFAGTPANVEDRSKELNRIYLDLCDWKPSSKPAATVAKTCEPSPSYVSNSDADTARAALNAISNSPGVDYDDWLNVGMALHSAGATVSDWESWSRQSDKYSEGECARKWNSFSPGKGISVASLCRMADATGKTWRPIANRSEIPDRPEDRLKGAIETAYLELNSGRSFEQVSPNLISVLSSAKTDSKSIIEPFSLKMLDSKAFASAEYKISYLCSKILVAEQPAMIAGPSKCLKTSISLDLVISLGTGTPFLGVFDVPVAVPVGIISGESGLYTLQRNARVIASQRGIKLEDAQCFWGETLPQISNKTHLIALRAMVNQYRLKACFVDPAYLCLLAGDTQGRSASSMFDMGPLLLELAKVGQDVGCAMILIHHNRKNSLDPYAIPELGDMAFSGFEQFSRQWLLLGRRERYEEGTGIHRVWVKSGGSVGHNGLWSLDVDEGILDDNLNGRKWLTTIGTASDAYKARTRAKAEAKENDQQIIAMLHRGSLEDAYKLCPEGETAKVLREMSKLNDANFKRINAIFLQENLVRPCKIFKNSVAYDGFKFIHDQGGSTGQAV